MYAEQYVISFCVVLCVYSFWYFWARAQQYETKYELIMEHLYVFPCSSSLCFYVFYVAVIRLCTLILYSLYIFWKRWFWPTIIPCALQHVPEAADFELRVSHVLSMEARSLEVAANCRPLPRPTRQLAATPPQPRSGTAVRRVPGITSY